MSDMMHHNNFSAADIEKYRKGLLTPAEMHALEKAALEDPFLADAMEGYRVGSPESGAGSQEDNIKDLRERLRKRVEGGKIRTLGFAGWWKIAAAIIVIAGGIWTYKAMNSSTAKEPIAAKEVAKVSPLPATVQADTVRANGNVEMSANASQVNTNDKKDSGFDITKLATRQKSSSTKSLANNSVVDTEALARKIDYRKTDTLQGQRDMAVEKRELLAKTAPRPAAAKDKDVLAKDTVHEFKVAISGYFNSPLNTFNGRILDKLNKPVPGASIEIPGRPQSYATDSFGYFSFKAPDTALKVSIASAGYVQRYYTLRNNGFNNNNIALGSGNNATAYVKKALASNAGFYSNQIILQPNNPALNEVVVVGYGARKKELVSNRDQTNATVPDAAPDTGWDEYNDYLEKNKKVPDGADDIHGNVVVRFNIDNTGTMKNFTIEKSLGDALDAEAIRLVKEGPSWHLLKSKTKKSKVTVMVRF